jgi:hypothetical protein
MTTAPGNIAAILSERQKTHGSFADHAYVTQSLKAVVMPFYDKLDAMQREAVDMILHKVGRICAGDPSFKDHWLDVAGYATLIADNLEA